jgi:hypothetical protein
LGVCRVELGVCGTDREILAVLYGRPPGYLDGPLGGSPAGPIPNLYA